MNSNSYVALLLRLRWQVFLNSLRHASRRFETGLLVIWICLGILFLVVTSAGFFFGTFGLLRIGRADLLDLLLWAVFLVWQLAPVLFEGHSPGLDFREVARYPVPFRQYFLLSAMYGLADPAAIAGLFWLASIWLGIVLSRPGWAFLAAVAFLFFALVNLFLGRLVLGLFERFQSTRRGREFMVILLFVFLLLPQLLQFVTGNWTNVTFHVPAWALSVLTPLRAFTPPGSAVRMFLLHGTPALLAGTVLALSATLACALVREQLHAVYQGEIHSEGRVRRRALKVHQGWRLPLLDEVTAAIIEKEFRYIRQSLRMVLLLIYPPVVFLLIALNGASRKLFFARSPEAMLAGMAGFILLSLPNLVYNNFGMDKEGFGRWLLAPPPLEKVLLAKNLANGVITTALFLLSEAIVIAVAHPRLPILALVTVAFFAAMLIHFAAGNMVSVYWPKRVELTKMNSRMASNAAGLVSVLVMVPVGAIAGMITLAWFAWRLPWLPLAAALIVLAVCLKLYSWILGRAAQYALAHIEEIAGNLGA